MGETDRSKGAKKLYGDTKAYSSNLGQQDFTTKNLFTNYQSPFGADQQFGKIDDIYNRGISDMNKSLTSESYNAQKGAANRLAGQGINKGSLYNNTVANAGQQAFNKKPGMMSQILNQKDNASLGVMGNANNLDLRRLYGEQGANQQNVANRMNQQRLLAQALGLQGNAVGMQDDTNWFDDSLAVANTAANVFKAFI